jgi:hypothetical protein
LIVFTQRDAVAIVSKAGIFSDLLEDGKGLHDETLIPVAAIASDA